MSNMVREDGEDRENGENRTNRTNRIDKTRTSMYYLLIYPIKRSVPIYPMPLPASISTTKFVVRRVADVVLT